MRYHDITKVDMKNGDGLRVVLWVSGCSHHCKECQNPITWNPDDGIVFDNSAKKEIFDELEKPYISGITFSGGDPLYKTNRTEIRSLMQEIRTKYPNKTIWLYTGYTIEEIFFPLLKNNVPTDSEICMMDIFKLSDVVVDGEFEIDNKSTQLKWKGSSNQRVIDVKKTLESKLIILYC